MITLSFYFSADLRRSPGFRFSEASGGELLHSPGGLHGSCSRGLHLSVLLRLLRVLPGGLLGLPVRVSLLVLLLNTAGSRINASKYLCDLV